MIKIISFLILISSIEVAVQESYKCSCEVNTLVRCKSNATAYDLCHQCQLTTCGPKVTVAYFHNYDGIPCMAKNVTKCCPHVKYVVIDHPDLCDCYCNMTDVIIVSASQTAPFECPCSPPNATTPICPTNSPHEHGIDQWSAFVGFGATMGVLVLVALVVLVPVLVYRKFKDGQFSFRRMDDSMAPIID